MTICLSVMRLLFVVLMVILCSSHAHRHTFYVGDKDGWAMKPLESYNQWAEKYHFTVNDELVFKFKKGHDSVLVVNENDYYKCNKDDPIKTLKAKDDKSRIKLNRSGPFFFISGHDQNCEYGQKLVVVAHHKTHHPHESPSPTTLSFPPLTHASSVQPPSNSPSQSPAATRPLSHAPLFGTPSHSPAPTPTVAKPLIRAPLVDPPSQSQSPSPAAAKPPSHAPLVDSRSHSPAAQPTIGDSEPDSDRSPSQSPETAKSPAHAPLVETPFNLPSQSPAAQNPSNDIEPDSDQSAPQSPAASKTPAYAPLDQPRAQSPSASSRKEAPVPSDHIALPPDVDFSSDHAPAPAPSSASGFGGSFVLILGLGLVANIISTGPLV